MSELCMEALQSALKQLQQSLLAGGGASCGPQIEHINFIVDDISTKHSDLVQALENKSISERALKNVVANKEAEAARLRGEVQRLRNSKVLDTTAADGTARNSQQKIDVQQENCEAFVSSPDPSARQAVLEQAIPAKDKPVAIMHKLQSEVSACEARIAALEAELEATRAEHEVCLSQQRDAFSSKLEQIREVHCRQLAAAATEAKETQEQDMACVQELEHQLLQLTQQLEEQKAANKALLQQLSQQQQQQPVREVQPAPGHEAGTTAEMGAPSQTGPAPTTAEARAAAMAEVAALRDMEAQLLRLSATVKSYQGEREQLRQALMAGCAERQALQQKVAELTAQLIQQPQGKRDAQAQQDAISRSYWGSLSN